MVMPVVPLAASSIRDIETEAIALSKFLQPEATDRDVRFEPRSLTA